MAVVGIGLIALQRQSLDLQRTQALPAELAALRQARAGRPEWVARLARERAALRAGAALWLAWRS